MSKKRKNKSSRKKNKFSSDRIIKKNKYTKSKGKKLKGDIIESLSSTGSELVGSVELSKNFAFLIPDNKHINIDVFIPLKNLNGVKDGQKAIVKIVDLPAFEKVSASMPKNSKNPVGEIIKILGYPGESETEINSIIAEYNLPLSFSKEIKKNVAKIPSKIPDEEITRRRDFRSVPTFTIDPADAKDFDDALSIKKIKKGNHEYSGQVWEIGIHIADVTHYVKYNSIIDKEALKRGTSAYLVDRVIPMLPERLSNKICSLVPNQEKLCFSAVFIMNDDAKIIDEWFGKTVICSDRRYTYDGVQDIIERKKDEKVNYDLLEEILTLNKLAKKLRKERFKQGSIPFDRIEVKVSLDKDGNPTGIYPVETKDSNHLIEEFMLLANKRVAEYIGKSKKTFVYRVHDTPDIEKLNTVIRFVKKLGYTIKANTRIAINKLLKDATGKAEENIITTLAIRTMAKAVYTTQNIGHYGLAFDYYTHFTSPIRRYPDMIVHRLLEKYLIKRSNKRQSRGIPDMIMTNITNDHIYKNENELKELCKHSSDKERNAEEAERASVKFKQLQFLSDKIGDNFEGIISGVTKWGIYVEMIENKCEGLVKIRDIDDDYYVFDEENFCIKGQRLGKIYQIGDRVKIVINRIDLAKKQLDLLLFC